jgi:5'(3')-deoxyribonucleotidase
LVATNMTDKIRIAIDMDEVLADTIDKFIEVYRRDHQTEILLEEMSGKEFHELLPDTLNDSWRSYVNQKGFFRDLKVMPDAQQVMNELCKKYDVYIVSAAMEFKNSLVDKLDWIEEHFPYISWKNIMFCGNKIVDVQIMIDDRIRNFANFNGRKLLFSSPHNFNITEYERVNNWTEVANKLL